MYRNKTSNDIHKRLIDAALSAKGKIAISHYRCDLYDDALLTRPGWNRYDVFRMSTMNMGKPTGRVESLYANYRA